MFKMYLLVLALCFCQVKTIAQRQFQGFYVTPNGEMVDGSFPQFREWRQNPTRVQFIILSGNLIELTPENCKSFTVTGYDTYESMQVKRMTNPTSYLSNIEKPTNEENFETINVFLRRIFKGDSLELYQLRDKKRENFFIKTNSVISELFFRVVYRYNTYSGTSQVFKDSKFIEQLKSLFAAKLAGDKKLANELDRLEYKENALVSFLNKVQNTGVKKQKNKYPSELVLVGGASYSTLRVTPYREVIYPTTLSYPSKISPVFGISYVEFGQRSFGKTMYAGEFKYYNFKHSARTVRYEEEFEYKAHVFTLGLSIGRKWIDENAFAWYTSLIPTGMLFIGNTETRTYLNSKTVSDGIVGNFRLGLQTGFIFRRLGVWGLYNVPTVKILQSGQYDAFHQSVQAGVDWRLKL